MQKFVCENLKRVRYNVSEALEKYDRSGQSVRIMAVTKTVAPEIINIAVQNGVDLLGENRVQEYLSKRDFYEKSAEVHFIGHLQTNKVKDIAGKVTMIQSVDSVGLATQINKISEKMGIVTDILVEVNIGGEESKSGIPPERLEDLLYNLSEMHNISVKGLMTIPPKEDSEKFFSKMYRLFIDISAKNIDNISMSVLSMGMSSDYVTGIKYGSNLIRIGSGLFGARK